MTSDSKKFLSAEMLERNIKEQMQKHPTGMVIYGGPRQMTAFHWTSFDTGEREMFLNMLSGVGQQAIHRGVLSKDAIIDHMCLFLKKETEKCS
jgi:hypothetical protein